jgi:3-hydroxy-9,10-secoandrosta-1,3,5(10)-triene-9,17-dione monooxygenase reductase component
MGNTGGVSEQPAWHPRDLADCFLGNFPGGLLGDVGSDFELRPGEHVEIGGEAAQARAREFRDVLGHYASGVTVVTTVLDGVPAGLTCQSFMSVSLDPPLVAFLPTLQSRAFAAIRRTGHFCVNILGADQVEVSDAMAGRRGEDKFAGVGWRTSATGAALLDGVLAYVDCTVHDVHEAGDHFLVVGRVVDLRVLREGEPLLYHRGGYRAAGPRV